MSPKKKKKSLSLQEGEQTCLCEALHFFDWYCSFPRAMFVEF